MGTQRKQKQIQRALSAMGWSHKTFAEVVYEELYENESGSSIDTDKEVIRKLAANIKKQLQRHTTPEALLDRYLHALSEHPDYQALNLGNILPNYVEHSCLSVHLTNDLALFSSELDEESEHEKGR